MSLSLPFIWSCSLDLAFFLATLAYKFIILEDISFHQIRNQMINNVNHYCFLESSCFLSIRLFFFFLINYFIFIFGCIGSSLLCVGFL